MTQVATSLSAGTNIVDNRTLDMNAPTRFWFDKATVTGHFDLYGVLDSTTTLVTQNVQPLGGFDVSPGQTEIPPEIQNALQSWPLLLAVSPGSATFIVEGNPAPSTATNQSVTAPTGSNFSALMTISSYDTAGVRVMASKAMTPSDQFNVYGTNDLTTNPTVTGTNGAQFLGNIFGSSGGAPTPGTSRVIQGWAAVFFQRDPNATGSTAGTIQGCGVITGVFPAVLASITPVPLTLVERDATGGVLATYVGIGGVGAALSTDATADIRITSTAQTVLSARNAANNANVPLLLTDGADGIQLSAGPVGSQPTVQLFANGNAQLLGFGAGLARCAAGATGNAALIAGTTSGNVNVDAPGGGACTVGGSSLNCTVGNPSSTAATTVRSGSGGLSLVANLGGPLTINGGTSLQWPAVDGVAGAVGGGSLLKTTGTGILSFTQFQSGTATLTAGTVTIAANVTASTRIVVTLKGTPSALTTQMQVPTRNVGAPGSFVVNGLVAAGTVNGADNSTTFDWFAIG